MSKERKQREETLPPGYSFQQREIQNYKNKVRPVDQRDFMVAVHICDFQNDWNLVGPDGEIVVRVSGGERQRAIDFLKLQRRNK